MRVLEAERMAELVDERVPGVVAGLRRAVVVDRAGIFRAEPDVAAGGAGVRIIGMGGGAGVVRLGKA